MIGRVIGNCRIVERLGHGGMGEVWKAEDLGEGRVVALKTLHADRIDSDSALARFRSEAEAIGRLKHPGIAAPVRSGDDAGTPFIVMEFVDGETLAAKIARGPMPIDEVLRIGREAAVALAHAHGRGVWHRDITTTNVMIAGDGRVVLVDFGLALVAGGTRRTSTGAIVGTPAYIAPEVARGHGADPRSDLWSLGVVLYEALTGKKPFAGETPAAMMQGVLFDAPRKPSELRSELTPEIDRLVLGLLAKEPGLRRPDATALVDALAELRGPTGASRTTRDVEELGPMIARPRCLVVMPFTDPATEGDSALASGFAEALASALAQHRQLHVVTPFAAREQVHDSASKVARELGADFVLSGTLLRGGARLRLSCTLYDAVERTLRIVAAIDGDISDLIDLQDKAASRVAESLALTTTGPGREAVAHVALEERYLQALGYLQRSEEPAAVEGAIRLLEVLAETPRAGPEVHSALARAYRYKFRLTREHAWLDRGLAECRKALARDAKSPEALAILAQLHQSLGRYAEAEAEFRRALEIRPDQSMVVLGLVDLYRAQGRYADAEQEGRRAIALRPDYWQGYNGLGATLFHAGRFDEAVSCWRRAAELAPNNPRAFSNLGAGLFESGDSAGAIAAYERSIAIQHTGGAYAGYGAVLFYLGRHAEAAQVLEKALVFDGSRAIMWGNLGDALRWVPGEEQRARAAHERAIELAREALRVNPVDAPTAVSLADWLVKVGAAAEGRAQLEFALRTGVTDVRDVLRAASAFELLGDRVRALEILEPLVGEPKNRRAIERDPDLRALREDGRYVALAR